MRCWSSSFSLISKHIPNVETFRYREATVRSACHTVAALLLAVCAGTAGAAGLDFRDRGTADPLLRDMVVAQGTTGTLQIDLPGGNYTVKVTMGDPSFPQNNMVLRVQGTVIDGDIDTVAGSYYTPSIPVTISPVSPATTAALTVQFSNNSTNYWVVNALTVMQGATTIHRFDFGSDSTPVAVGYTAVHPATIYDSSIGYGWVEATFEKLKLVKVPNTGSPAFPSQADYMIALERFPLWAERGWHPSTVAGQPGYFGDSDNGELSMRTMGNFIFTYAILATDPTYDPAPSGVAQSLLLSRARECLDHMCRTHITGDMNRPSGNRWGNHWQSAWWTTRMAAGAKVMWAQLSAAERAAAERVVVYEANRHIDRTAPSGTASDTKSEENAWDSEVLAWACSMFPSHANASKWQTKAIEFSMNTLSVPQDETNTSYMDSSTTTVAQWVYTQNVHPDYTIENHGAYHFCYMACPLHSFAWGYYGYVSNGRGLPMSLFHHYRDVYKNIAKTWLGDGRFAYLAGKDWPRYAYGLYFIMPALSLLQEVDDDKDARLFERERFRLFEWESRQSNDGSFMSKRFTSNVFTGRLVEYETDTAANLGLSYLYHKRQAPPPATSIQDFLASATQSFISDNSSFALTRDDEWFASFSWRSLSNRNCTAIVVPHTAGDMAEWGADQFLSSFTLKGVAAANLNRSIIWKDQDALPANGGFSAIGQIDFTPATQTVKLERRVAFVALQELNQALVIDELWARDAVTLSALAGCRMYLPNDLFNGNERRINLSGSEVSVVGAGSASSTQEVFTSYANVDERLSIIPVKPQGSTATTKIRIQNNSSRQAPFASLSYELLEWDGVTSEQNFTTGQLIRRSVFLVGTSTEAEAETIAASQDLVTLPTSNTKAIVAVVPGLEGQSYFVGANFDTAPAIFAYTVPPGSRLQNSSVSFTIPPRSALTQQEPSAPVASSAVRNWKNYAKN